VLMDGVLRCWGYNSFRQISLDLPPPGPIPGTYSYNVAQDEPTPVVIPNVTNAIAVSVGAVHICALLNDNTVLCWGNNQYGQLGNGSTTTDFVPVAVLGIANAVAIAAGAQHSCALLKDGTIRCWGMNYGGQLGSGMSTTIAPFGITTPVAVTSITNAVAIASGESHTCAIIADSTVLCWGDNYDGQLGNGTTTSSAVPVTVSGITTAAAIAGGRSYTCVILTDGSIRCWGRNYYGQLGNGTRTTTAPALLTPVTVLDVTSAVAIGLGSEHSCAVLAGGSVRCWGLNSNGQLGDGTTTDSAVPVTVRGF
jgi:alpha-tubulin suppressor-like RCC1 family protein